MKITVAICTKDRAEKFYRCLRSVAAQTQVPTTCLIVEDVSVQETLSTHYIQTILKNVNIDVVHEKVKYKSIPRSRNHVLDHSTGDVLICVDDDVVLAHDAVARVAQFFRTHTDAALVTGTLSAEYPDYDVSIVDALYFNQGMLGFDQPSRIPMCPFSLVALRMSHVMKSDVRFDETLENSEDVDYTLSLTKEGKHLYVDPLLQNMHSFDTSLLQYLHKKFQHGKCIYILQKKHGDIYMRADELPVDGSLFFLPYFILRQAKRNTKYYHSLQALVFKQRCIVFLGEVATLCGSAFQRFHL